MEGKRFIRRIRLKNLLSYGEHFEGIDLEPLNVLIGPNGSGKSNLIEAISLLAACPGDLAVPFRRGGGIGEWFWKGAGPAPLAQVETMTDDLIARTELPHLIEWGMSNSKTFIEHESIGSRHKNAQGENEHVILIEISEGIGRFLLRGYQSRSVQESFDDKTGSTKLRNSLFKILLNHKFIEQIDEESIAFKTSVDRGQSILSQFRWAELSPEIARLGEAYSKIRIYRGWGPAAFTKLREPARADLDADFLFEDAANLANILRSFDEKGTKPRIIELIQRFFDPVTDITTTEFGGLLQILWHERGLREPIPAARLSDGTLQYLILLAILCHPDPPPLVCIEEPELGLHPDIIPTIAELLIEASSRTQLIVTTHSADLISALGEVPEAVVVCEREAEGTTLRRLEPEKMKKWLEDYTLGHLWATGELGGNRW